MKINARFIALMAVAAGAPCLAQSVIDPAHKFSWSENCGWMNWNGNNLGGQGVFVASSYLTGRIWCENAGWVSVGHPPADGHHHANTNGLDYGVNIDPSGELSGFAWGENIGWINFHGGALASPPNPARLDSAAFRLRGFAWCENAGWLNLDSLIHYVGITCPADVDDGSGTGIPDGGVGIEDLLYFLVLFNNGDIRADIDDGSETGTPSGGVGIEDLLYYLFRFDAGC